jgi:hypothetical protein
MGYLILKMKDGETLEVDGPTVITAKGQVSIAVRAPETTRFTHMKRCREDGCNNKVLIRGTICEWCL